MGDLLIRNVSDALKRDIAERAERNGRSLSDETKSLLQKAMASEGDQSRPMRSGLEGLREIFAPLAPEEREAIAAMMDEVEAERKKDFGRPAEDLE